MPAILCEQALNPLQDLNDYQNKHLQPGSYGAGINFIGTMRDYNAGTRVKQMTLEHYPAMTQEFLDKSCQDALSR